MKRTFFWMLILGLVITTGIVGCAKEEEIKIGAVLPLTGEAAFYGEVSKKGMDLALDEVNRNGKFKKIQIIYEDSRSTPEGAVSAFQKLISHDRVPVAIGFILSNGALAAAPVANSSEVILLSISASTEKFREVGGEYAFRIRESGLIHGRKIASYAVETLKAKTAALFYANAENGITYANGFRSEFKNLGGDIVFDESFSEGEKDFRTALSKIKKVAPNVVYIAGLNPEIGLILRQSWEIGLKASFLCSPGAEHDKTIEIAGDAAEGVIYTSAAFEPSFPQTDIQKSFVEKYKQRYGEIPPFFLSGNGYDAVKLIAEIIHKYGYSSKDIKKGLLNTIDFPGVGGNITFDSSGEVMKDVLIKQIKDGKFHVLKLEH